MKRYILLVENTGFRPSDGRRLLDELRMRGYGVVDVRVGTKHVEVDIRSDSEPVVEGLNVYEVREIRERPIVDPDVDFRAGIAYFNVERFWEAHETWEPIWREAKGPEKKTLHGLILTAAAFVHLQKNDEKGFKSILQRALKQLSAGVPFYRGLDIKEVMEKIRAAAETNQAFKLC